MQNPSELTTPVGFKNSGVGAHVLFGKSFKQLTASPNVAGGERFPSQISG
jgi:hypothetical protein